MSQYFTPKTVKNNKLMELWNTVLLWIKTRFKCKDQDNNKWIIDFIS